MIIGGEPNGFPGAGGWQPPGPQLRPDWQPPGPQLRPEGGPPGGSSGVASLAPDPAKRMAGPVVAPKAEFVPATAGQQAISILLATISAVIFALLGNLVLISPVQHTANQTALFAELRLGLAEGSTPVGPAMADGGVVEPGVPVAVLEAPRFGIEREVIVQGTAGAQTMVGIGHRRDTVMPCQLGSSVLMARATAYGGVGSVLAAIQPGGRFTITMGQGTCTYQVLGQRMVGDPAPPAPLADQGRLTINTASGLPFMPTEVLRIDAELVTDPFDRPVAALPAGALPASEAAMATDNSNLFGLILLLEVLVGAAIGITWMWRRWGRWQTWIVGVPVIASIGVLTATVINQTLLPNLL